MASESVVKNGKKISRKWVKAANMWCKVVTELGAKDSKGKEKTKITWSVEQPSLTDD
jgi:hypothetical protein